MFRDQSAFTFKYLPSLASPVPAIGISVKPSLDPNAWSIPNVGENKDVNDKSRMFFIKVIVTDVAGRKSEASCPSMFIVQNDGKDPVDNGNRYELARASVIFDEYNE